MSIPPGESIGLEMHPETQQFLRLDAGQGKAQMGPAADQFTFEQDVTDGWCVLVPAGTWHDVTNTGDGPMRLYAIYAPVHHAAGKVQPTAVDAERDEKAGTDKPPTRSIPAHCDSTGRARDLTRHRSTLRGGSLPPSRSPWRFSQHLTC